MHDDLVDLVQGAAAEPRQKPDFDALAARGRRQHLVGRAATVVVAVTALVVGGVVLWPDIASDRMPVIGNPPGTPSGQEDASTGSTDDGSSTWQEPTDYDYTLASCGGGSRLFAGTFHIEVRNGEVSSIEPLTDYPGPGDAAMLLEEAPTIGDLTARVEEAQQRNAVVAHVTDGEDGQPPVRVEIDPRANAIDDEECYEIRDYAPTDATAPEASEPTGALPIRCESVQSHADFRTKAWFPTADEALEWATQRSPHGFVRAGSDDGQPPHAPGRFVRYADDVLIETAEVVRNADDQWSVDAIETCR